MKNQDFTFGCSLGIESKRADFQRIVATCC